MATYTNPKNGQQVSTEMTMEQVAEELGKLTGDFPSSLIGQRTAGRPWSPAQQYWAVKLVNDALGKPQDEVSLGGDSYEGVLALFTTAKASGLQRPKLHFRLPGGKEITLSVAGAKAKVPGSINVVHGSRKEWAGRITREGVFQPKGQTPQFMVDFLKEMATDPIATAAKYGKLAGVCCFCHHPLTDERSTSVGYGPVCAKNWGLPWGENGATTTTTTTTKEAKETPKQAKETSVAATIWSVPLSWSAATRTFSVELSMVEGRWDGGTVDAEVNGKVVTFDYLSADYNGDDVAGWRFKERGGNRVLLIIND